MAGELKGFPHTLNRTLKVWDAMDIAKHYPGQLDTPFVAGMNIISSHTGVINQAHVDINKVAADGGMRDLGTEDYCVIAYSPVMSALYGDRAFGSNDKIAGLSLL